MGFWLTRPLALVGALVALLVTSQGAIAQAKIGEEQRKEFVRRLAAYGQCNQSCAADVAKVILDEGGAATLAVAGLAKGDSKVLKGPAGILSFYLVLNQIWAGGNKIVDTHKVCAQSCDKLYSDIQELGSAGLLGPITAGKPIPEEWFKDPKVKALWDKHIKPLKASDLPAAFHNDARWKEIMNTA
jgi:hypothetical protein